MYKERMVKKVIGVFLISSPIIGIVIMLSSMGHFLEAMLALGIAAVILGVSTLGMYLFFSDTR
jgi:uncharacterized membrane protein